MAIINLGCHTIGNYNAHTLTAGSTKPTAVNLPDDDNTSYISTTADLQRQSFQVDALPGGALAVTNVDITGRTRGTGAFSGDYSEFTRLSATDLDYALVTNPTGAWTDRSKTAIARPGGGSWVVADFNGTATEAGIIRNGGTSQIETTSLYMPVTYTTSPSLFTFMVSEWWLPALLGIASHSMSIREIQDFFMSWKLRPSEREEFEAINFGLSRRPVYVGA